MEIWQKDLLEVLRDIIQRIPGSYIYDIDRSKVVKQIDLWLEQVGNVAKPNACPQLCEGWRDASKELPPEKETENIWEKGMSDNVLILLGGCYHIACYHHRAEKWMIPGFCGEWKPEAWKKIVPPAFV